MHRMYIGQFGEFSGTVPEYVFSIEHTQPVGTSSTAPFFFHGGYPSLPMSVAATHTRHHIASRVQSALQHLYLLAFTDSSHMRSSSVEVIKH